MRRTVGTAIHWALFLAIAIQAPRSYGQGAKGIIQGIVKYPSGNPVYGAEVLLTSKTTRRQYHATTATDGKYVFQGLPAGEYALELKAAGFKTVKVDSIRISRRAAAAVDSRAGTVSRNVDIVLKDQNRLPPPPPPPPVQSFTDPVWNIWTERSSKVAFQPLRNLQPNRDFTLVIDLAALRYRELEGDNVYSQPGAGALVDWINQNRDIDAADLEVLAIPDPRYFAIRPAERVKRLSVDLRKIRAARNAGFKVGGSPFEQLRSHGGDTPFSFGIQAFELRTIENAPLGSAPVALSIWADGKPIDEVAVNLCVAANPGDACPTSSAGGAYTLGGVDLSGSQKFPDGALHLIERGGDVVGVFCSPCSGQYFTWTIGQQADGWLADRVNEIVQHLTPPVPARYFTQAGDDLYNLIFPNAQDSDEAAAETAFGKFFAKAYAKGRGAAPPSLFVRMLSGKRGLVLLPLALMRVPLAKSKKDFLGFSVNIEAPLELQDYSVPSKCISDWVLFVPPSGANESFGDLADARDYASGWIDRMAKLCPSCTYTDPDSFSDWLLGNRSEPAASGAQALVVLSQYKNNSLFFSTAMDNPPSVSSTSIRRMFAGSSFAILDACGTAAPGGSEFIRALNSHGVNSLISTSAAIPGPMGGLFLDLFMKVLTEHPEYTVSRARYEAVKALSQKPGGDSQPYGPQALEFTLVGNGSLKLCPPGQ